jgi:hypothetical protein
MTWGTAFDFHLLIFYHKNFKTMNPNNQTQNQRVQSPDDARQQHGTNEDEQLKQEGNNEKNQSINGKFTPSNQDRSITAVEQRETDADWEKPEMEDDNDIDPEDIESENDDDVPISSSRLKEDYQKRVAGMPIPITPLIQTCNRTKRADTVSLFSF